MCLGIQSVFVFYLYIFFDPCGARVRWTRTLEEAGEEEEEEEQEEEQWQQQEEDEAGLSETVGDARHIGSV